MSKSLSFRRTETQSSMIIKKIEFPQLSNIRKKRKTF